jgi:hypothetical protein
VTATVPAEPLRTFSTLGKLRLILEIATMFARVRWRMRRDHDVGRLMENMREGQAPMTSPTVEEVWYGRRMGNVVEKVVRRFPGDTRCLARSLVLVRLLSRRGIGTTLVIGVRSAPDFGAHAWVELAGNPLLMPIEAGGERLTSF